MTVDRIGVSFEPELLEKFDAFIGKKGYTNRSEAIRDIVRDAMVKDAAEHSKGEVFGTITIVYDHHSGSARDRLMEMQHQHYTSILFTSHVHVDHDTCLEVLVVKGESEGVKHLADQLRAIKGVKHGHLAITRADI